MDSCIFWAVVIILIILSIGALFALIGSAGFFVGVLVWIVLMKFIW